MCPCVSPCVSSYLLAPTKWTQNQDQGIQKLQKQAESQGETGKKPSEIIKNHSKPLKKHQKQGNRPLRTSKNTSKAVKTTQNTTRTKQKEPKHM